MAQRKSNSNLNEEGLHHAYLVTGPLSDAEAFLLDLLATSGIDVANNPDVLRLSFDTLGIDEARELSTRASYRSLSKKKIFFISFTSITPEAQNALLKTFEDPYPHTHFVVSAPLRDMLIPTLLSRMHLVRGVGENILDHEEHLTENVEMFMNSPVSRRMEFAKEFADDGGDISAFLDILMLKMKEAKKGFAHLYPIRRLASDRAVSARMILEHLAFVV